MPRTQHAGRPRLSETELLFLIDGGKGLGGSRPNQSGTVFVQAFLLFLQSFDDRSVSLYALTGAIVTCRFVLNSGRNLVVDKERPSPSFTLAHRWLLSCQRALSNMRYTRSCKLKTLAVRRFLGIGLEEDTPDHSTTPRYVL